MDSQSILSIISIVLGMVGPLSAAFYHANAVRFKAWSADLAGRISVIETKLTTGFRAEASALEARLSVLESQVHDNRTDITNNYNYCHQNIHETRGLITSVDARLHMVQHHLRMVRNIGDDMLRRDD